MFIILLTYKKPLAEVEKNLEAHKTYLDKNYAAGNFIASGRQNPRVGGVILCRANSKDDVMRIVGTDPFFANDVADYQITEFIPSKYAKGFENFI